VGLRVNRQQLAFVFEIVEDAAGGWVGLLCGALAMYGSFAVVTNATYGRDVVPTGAR
jgi:succinate-acetate transporter protein